MTARIYQPSKTAMQSGRAKTKFWVLEHIPTLHPRIESVMCWTGGGDTLANQVRLKFNSKEAAIKYANAHSLEYEVLEPQRALSSIKSYIEIFKKI